jgi:hypothetical protein
MSDEETTKRARTTDATTKTAARDAAQAATREKATLEARVSELERDLGTATMDLATVAHQFSQVSDQLQKVSEEATQLRESNAKLLEDLQGESCGCFLSSLLLLPVSCRVLTHWSSRRGALYRAGMTAKLAEQKQELNTALLKVIEKDGAIGRLSEQL